MDNKLNKHAPGPWHLEPLQSDQGASIAICGPDDYGVLATIQPLNADDEPDIHTAVREPYDDANARLIAAAPELLEALRAMFDAYFIGQHFTATSALGKAHAAISKAEGN